MRRWTSLASFIAIVVQMLLAPPLHRAFGAVAYFLDVLVFIAAFLLARHLFKRLDS